MGGNEHLTLQHRFASMTLNFPQHIARSLYDQLCRHVHDAAAKVQVHMESKLTAEVRAAACLVFEHYGVDYEFVNLNNKAIASPYRL